MSKEFKVHTGDSGGSSPPAYYRESKLGLIDINSEESLSKWEGILHMTRPQLLAAIKSFGPMVRDIRRGLLNQNNNEAA